MACLGKKRQHLAAEPNSSFFKRLLCLLKCLEMHLNHQKVAYSLTLKKMGVSGVGSFASIHFNQEHDH